MASPAPNWPDMLVMLQSLQTSGVLTRTEPAAPIQPLPKVPERPNHHVENLVAVTEVDTPSATIEVSLLDRPWSRWFTRLIGVVLSVQGMYHMYVSLHFLFVEYALLEQKLMEGEITPLEVNHLAGKAILEIISSLISMFFALRLTVLQSKTAHGIHVVLGIFFFILNSLVVLGYLDYVDFTGFVTKNVLLLIDLSRGSRYN